MREKVNILIVDDLKENHLVMESVLDDPQLHIVKAYSGEEALFLCVKHDFAVVFMDVQMPGMDGIETAMLLRGIEKTKNIPIIFVTANSKEKNSVFKGYEVGAVDYLFKPIDPIVLKSKARIFKELYLQRRLIELQTIELKDALDALMSLEVQRDELESISLEDPLTEIYNRRGVDKLLQMHWKNCVRYQLPMSILLFDLDRFKNYNDNYGHVKGDVVLKSVAEVAKNTLFRAEDYVGRYGGEEFIIVMPNTTLEGALNVANRLRENIQNRHLVYDFNGEFGLVTVSIGVVMTYPVSDVDTNTIIDMADQMMYLAKKNGRNRINHTIV